MARGASGGGVDAPRGVISNGRARVEGRRRARQDVQHQPRGDGRAAPRHVLLAGRAGRFEGHDGTASAISSFAWLWAGRRRRRHDMVTESRSTTRSSRGRRSREPRPTRSRSTRPRASRPARSSFRRKDGDAVGTDEDAGRTTRTTGGCAASPPGPGRTVEQRADVEKTYDETPGSRPSEPGRLQLQARSVTTTERQRPGSSGTRCRVPVSTRCR